MNIQEAIQSGRRFKRKGAKIWRLPKDKTYFVEDLLADDWELEAEQKVAVTKTDLKNAFFLYVSPCINNGGAQRAFDYFIKELGFE